MKGRFDIMAITGNDIKDAVKFTFTAANVAKDFSKLAKRNSIMKMAAPAMYQYPVMMSRDIETPVAMAIAQAYQQTYAASVVTAYSLNPVMSLKDYRNPSEFVQKFHSNDGNSDFNFLAARNALVGESATTLENTDDEVTFDVASAVINREFSAEAMESINLRAWDIAEEMLDKESLNDMYRPYDRTDRILREKVGAFKSAKESAMDTLNNVGSFVDDLVTSTVSNPNSMSNVGLNDGVRERNKFNAVVRNDRLDAMEPTMVNVQILCHGKTGQFTQNLVLGVKTMVRLVSSELMIATMVEACKDTKFIFKLLKWTRGEKNTLDYITGWSASKTKALERNAKMEAKVLKQSKKRGKAGFLKRALNNEVMPTLSIVLTTYEVEKIKSVCGVDLSDLKQAMKLMNKYCLLSFAIYDQTQNTLQTLFDCDDDWAYIHVGAMKSMVNKTVDLMNQNEILKMFGRR